MAEMGAVSGEEKVHTDPFGSLPVRVICCGSCCCLTSDLLYRRSASLAPSMCLSHIARLAGLYCLVKTPT